MYDDILCIIFLITCLDTTIGAKFKISWAPAPGPGSRPSWASAIWPQPPAGRSPGTGTWRNEGNQNGKSETNGNIYIYILYVCIYICVCVCI